MVFVANGNYTFKKKEDAIRNLRARSATSALTNATTMLKGAHTTESRNFIVIQLLSYTELFPLQ